MLRRLEARFGDQLRQAPCRLPLVPSRSTRPADVWTGDEDEVVIARQLGVERPERLAQRPLDRVSLDRAADLAADRDPEPDLVGGRLSARGNE